MVFLTGRSGAGKSTVLKLIALLERRRAAGHRRRRNTATLPSRASRRSAARSASCSRTTSC
jgi:ABC-type lipoprotein export system ATPase subunit